MKISTSVTVVIILFMLACVAVFITTQHRAQQNDTATNPDPLGYTMEEVKEASPAICDAIERLCVATATLPVISNIMGIQIVMKISDDGDSAMYYAVTGSPTPTLPGLYRTCVPIASIYCNPIASDSATTAK